MRPKQGDPAPDSELSRKIRRDHEWLPDPRGLWRSEIACFVERRKIWVSAWVGTRATEEQKTRAGRREGVREEVAEDIEVTTSRRVENDAQGGLAGSKGAKEGDEAEAGWRGEEEAEATKAVERISEGRGRSKLS
jgi:hypothetical protein